MWRSFLQLSFHFVLVLLQICLIQEGWQICPGKIKNRLWYDLSYKLSFIPVLGFLGSAFVNLWYYDILLNIVLGGGWWPEISRWSNWMFCGSLVSNGKWFHWGAIFFLFFLAEPSRFHAFMTYMFLQVKLEQHHGIRLPQQVKQPLIHEMVDYIVTLIASEECVKKLMLADLVNICSLLCNWIYISIFVR